MKKIIILLPLICATFILSAQIATRPLPKSGFEQRIRDEVYSIKLIDTHEHLHTEEAMFEHITFDFTKLFQLYLQWEFVSSGMTNNDKELLTKENITLQEKWEIISPFWERCRTTGYGRVPLIAAKDLFGIDDINEDTYVALSKKIKETIKPGYYKQIFDKAGIDLAILDVGRSDDDTALFRHVIRFEHYVQVFQKGDVLKRGEDINTLDDYVEALQKDFQVALDEKMVAVKSALAYSRIINYEDVKKSDAENLFDKIMEQDDENDIPLSFEEVKPLQDYVMHQIIQLADKHNLPIQIHTGLHAGNGNIIGNSNPTHLTNLFFQYPNVKFILFHSSYPFGGELSTLAKNFPNVYIDMCWSAIISPSYSVRYLSEWLETVPNNKIMAFGGDITFVEGTYAHSIMAREIVVTVLTQKVKDGFYSEKEAFYIANRILRENAIDIFKLYGRDFSVTK